VKLTSSPCIQVCTIIDEYCIGCGRHSEEITEWLTATNERKTQILERIESDRSQN
jgi:predicted Fe-S protein YdhL (DUF1289 family)